MRAGLFLAGALIAGAAVAQQTGEEAADVPATKLDVPKNLTVFGKSDPNVYKATAIVNGEIITSTDVEHRLALVLLANQGRVSAEERERLRLQVLRNLIDETLQIQEAKAAEVEVKPEEVNQRYAAVAQNFKRTPQQMDIYLRDQGSSARSIKRQIEGELAWQRVLGRKITPFVNVGQEEVQSIIDRLNASKGAKEYRLGEIFLSGTPETMQETMQNGQRILQQLQQGGSFQAYARQFSEASTAAVGGDLGWIRTAQLPEALAEAAQNMRVGQVAGPIPVPGGVSILVLVDERQVLTADPRDAVLSLKQLAITFPKGMTQAQAGPQVAKFAEETKKITGCGSAKPIADTLGAEVVDNDQVRVRDLPPQLQEILLNLQVGQTTQPFGSLEDGVRVLVLCGRDDPESANGPSFDRIMAQLEDERINRRAQRYLRDLRRDAVVDYQ
ncbi:peptidylprolyl isomerase [Sphingomonas sp. LaA6.9]|uniref:peptidylprolyl isomerase n=1 Tax=Sphingomonas sp. LaA6.9 TaxID=2919914 RepID=UPI001F4FE606|nr:peptidylprolyl isomerase [Sphingomonas sp. LaA6.9]MCJ8157875.1 peptidylprolyl isomerase [Sphingomonas sp. LaA6.9]